MANYTLAEAKKVFGTDKVHETDTGFLVNDFGKYRPNITFVVGKKFEQNPLEHRSDGPVSEMLANMNVGFGGQKTVLFGDFWTSRKGGACFRPKPIDEAKHVFIKVGWGGAFSSSRGIGTSGDVAYRRRAASNGGGMGNDYLVVPIGFYRALHDDEVDGDSSSTTPDFVERAKAIREQFVRFDREQADKAAAKAKAKAEAETASRSAKIADLGQRMETVNGRRSSIGHWEYELGETYFGAHGSFSGTIQNERLYTEANVEAAEREVMKLEEQSELQVTLDQLRKELGQVIEEADCKLWISDSTGSWRKIELKAEDIELTRSFEYSSEGSEELEKAWPEFLAEVQAKRLQLKRVEDAETDYQTSKSEATEVGLPQNIEIWKRTGGRTGAGNGWVIGPNGMDRDPTSMWNSNPHRLERYGEGYMVWEQILHGEVVLQWSKGSSAAPHEFEVIHLPEEGLTEAQLERIAEIQQSLEEEWEGARGMASGLPSPPIGEGWGLLPNPTPAAVDRVVATAAPDEPIKPVSEGSEIASGDRLADLAKHFGK